MVRPATRLLDELEAILRHLFNCDSQNPQWFVSGRVLHVIEGVAHLLDECLELRVNLLEKVLTAPAGHDAIHDLARDPFGSVLFSWQPGKRATLGRASPKGM